MRSSILVLAAGLAAVGVACTAVGAGDPADAQEPPRAESTSAADLQRDLEIMRRLLAREALAAGTANRDPSSRYAVFHSPPNVTDRAVEAFHVKGDGALFLVRTSDAVAPSPGGAEEGGGAKPEATAWDRIAEEMDGGPRRIYDFVRDRSARYDAAKVEALRDRILEQLAKYGGRLRGLDAADHLTVVVTGGASAGQTVVVTGTTGTVVQDDGTRDLRALALGDRPVADRTVLTIRVALADCRPSANGGGDLAEFRRRAVIAAY